MKNELKIELGDQVKDSITGFAGVVIGRTQWLHGCDRLVVQPLVDKDGKKLEAETFDEPQLMIVKRAHIKIAPKSPEEKTGGFDIKAVQKATPRR